MLVVRICLRFMQIKQRYGDKLDVEPVGSPLKASNRSMVNNFPCKSSVSATVHHENKYSYIFARNTIYIYIARKIKFYQLIFVDLQRYNFNFRI